MNARKALRLATATAVAACLIVPAVHGQATRNDKSATSKVSDRQERASGVIVKVEQATKAARPGSTIEKETKAGSARPVSRRLTINTNAVWRDWARDQARIGDNRSAKQDSKEGANSVATAGEPIDRNNLVVIDIGPDTGIETRFRSPDDETGKGSKSLQTASSHASNGSEASKGGARASAKPVHFRVDDLKPGLFVEVDFQHLAAQNPARTVTVVRPVGGGDTPTRTGATSDK